MAPARGAPGDPPSPAARPQGPRGGTRCRDRRQADPAPEPRRTTRKRCRSNRGGASAGSRTDDASQPALMTVAHEHHRQGCPGSRPDRVHQVLAGGEDDGRSLQDVGLRARKVIPLDISAGKPGRQVHAVVEQTSARCRPGKHPDKRRKGDQRGIRSPCPGERGHEQPAHDRIRAADETEACIREPRNRDPSDARLPAGKIAPPPVRQVGDANIKLGPRVELLGDGLRPLPDPVPVDVHQDEEAQPTLTRTRAAPVRGRQSLAPTPAQLPPRSSRRRRLVYP